MNKEWHKANKMQERATREQRIKWHLAHAKKCGCRPIPPKIRGELKKRHRHSPRCLSRNV